MRVGQASVAPLGNTEDLSRPLGFFTPQRRATAGPGLPSRQVQDRGAVPLVRGPKQGTGASELDVVAMRGDGENIDWHQKLSVMSLQEYRPTANPRHVQYGA